MPTWGIWQAAIRPAWCFMVLPCLLLNYFGQGALMLRDTAARVNPFYSLAPELLLYSVAGPGNDGRDRRQSGADLRRILHHAAVRAAGLHATRHHHSHVESSSRDRSTFPEINTLLGIGTICAYFGFKSSTALAAAYGIAVTGTMAITTLLFYEICVSRWNWPHGRHLRWQACFSLSTWRSSVRTF